MADAVAQRGRLLGAEPLAIDVTGGKSAQRRRNEPELRMLRKVESVLPGEEVPQAPFAAIAASMP